MSECLKDIFIETTSGQTFYLFDPDPSSIDLEDIVTSLERIPRYCGHGKVAWSVLAHSVCVAKMVPQQYKMTALLHDATEAYIHDISRPLKSTKMFDNYRKLEHKIWLTIAKKFGCHEVIPECVHAADNAITWYEVQMLMHRPLGPWWNKYKHYADMFAKPEAMESLAGNSGLAREAFMIEFSRLQAISGAL
jgi:hypothetical protein